MAVCAFVLGACDHPATPVSPVDSGDDSTGYSDARRLSSESLLEIAAAPADFLPADASSEGDADLKLVRGPQGGYHVLLSLRLGVEIPDEVLAAFHAERDDGEVVAEAELDLTGRTEPHEDYRVYPRYVLFLDIEGPAELAGRMLTVGVKVSARGRPLTQTERRFSVRFP